MIRNLSLDLTGFFLTMGAAMYAGRLAGWAREQLKAR
jgi:hypothetical protein